MITTTFIPQLLNPIYPNTTISVSRETQVQRDRVIRRHLQNAYAYRQVADLYGQDGDLSNRDAYLKAARLELDKAGKRGGGYLKRAATEDEIQYWLHQAINTR